MKRKLRELLVGAAAMLVIAPAFASAPPDQYDAFNRQNDTIRDSKTQLTWQRYVDSSLRDYASAESYCATLRVDASDARAWRLPTVKELLTLVDEQPHVEYQIGTGLQTLAIDARAFPDTAPGEYWSSSYAFGHAWFVDFEFGESNYGSVTTGRHVRCVSDSR